MQRGWLWIIYPFFQAEAEEICNIVQQAFELIYTEATMDHYNDSISFSTQPPSVMATPLPPDPIVTVATSKDIETSQPGNLSTVEMWVKIFFCQTKQMIWFQIWRSTVFKISSCSVASWWEQRWNCWKISTTIHGKSKTLWHRTETQDSDSDHPHNY